VVLGTEGRKERSIQKTAGITADKAYRSESVPPARRDMGRKWSVRSLVGQRVSRVDAAGKDVLKRV